MASTAWRRSLFAPNGPREPRYPGGRADGVSAEGAAAVLREIRPRSNLAAGSVEGNSSQAASRARRQSSAPASSRGRSSNQDHRVSPDRDHAGHRSPGIRVRQSLPMIPMGRDLRARAMQIGGAGGAGAAAAEARGQTARRELTDRRVRAQLPPPESASAPSPRNRMDPLGIAMDGDFSLFERHIDALYRSALRLTRKPEDAEDLVQETYLRAYRYRRKFQPGTNEKAWLFTIMTNLFRNRLRQRPAPEDPLDEPGTDFFIYDQLRREGMPVHLMSPEEIVVDRGFGDEVKRALEDLPVAMRMVVMLVDVEDFSYKEAAAILGVKIGTVMSRLHRGRRALQKRLWEYSGRPRSSVAVGGRA